MFGLVVVSTCGAIALAWSVEPMSVEFHRVGVTEKGVRLPGLENHWRPFPVEYKRGQSKGIDCDRVQLCAQALCLEDMLRVSVPVGALFYGQARRREEVVFDADLRDITERAARPISRPHGVRPDADRLSRTEVPSLFSV